jgi:hypothetical protein
MSAQKSKQIEYWDLDETHFPWVQAVFTMNGPSRHLELIGFDGNCTEVSGDDIYDEDYDIDTHNILIVIGVVAEGSDYTPPERLSD